MSWKAVGWVAALVAIGWTCSLALAQEPGDQSSRWPVLVQTSAGQVTVFKPQIEDLQGDQLSARAVVSVQGPDGQTPVFGCVWLQSRVLIDRDAGTVKILDVNITHWRFPDSSQIPQDGVLDGVRQVFTAHPATLSLDRLLKTLDIVHKAQAAATQLQDAPPQIIFLDHAAVKLQYDGDPRLTQVNNSSLLRVINTPFFVACDPATKSYYLKGGGAWFSAPDPLGPFHHEFNVPQEVAALADSTGYQDPQQPLTSDQADNIEIVTATEPTELICTDGPAQMGIIPGTQLLYFANTDSDVFLHMDSQQLYVLLSGRWYTAAGRKGPWTYVPPDQLPDDFARIPRDGAKSNVLVDVAGTKAAQDAVDDAYVPQIAAVDMGHFDPPPVQYDGAATFQPIQGTDMTYATNTDASVIQSGGTYYCCHNAVWYNGASPSGPWGICTSVPSEIYTIPPSCPVYSVRFCYVYGRAGNVCYVGYLPGYLGCYPTDGVVVYGTGYRYQPWIGRTYYGRADSFGFGAVYDGNSGQWGFSFAASFGGGGGWIGGSDGRGNRSWFGNGGYHADRGGTGRYGNSGQGRGGGEPQGRVDVYGNRGDVRGEFGPSRGQFESYGQSDQRSDMRGGQRGQEGAPPYSPSHQRSSTPEQRGQNPSGSMADYRGNSGGQTPSQSRNRDNAPPVSRDRSASQDQQKSISPQAHREPSAPSQSSARQSEPAANSSSADHRGGEGSPAASRSQPRASSPPQNQQPSNHGQGGHSGN